MIAVAVCTHGNVDVTLDTVDSVRTYMTENVIMVVDKAGWQHYNNVPDAVQGLYHNCDRGNYRNYAFGIKHLSERFPEADWYGWLEYDVLVTSSKIVKDLEKMASNVWMLGCDLRKHRFDYPFFSEITGEKIRDSYYLLGCCHFLRKEFVDKLVEVDFFNKLLVRTAECRDGDFPGYDRHAFEEEMCPTLAVHYGGHVQELSCWLDHQGSVRDCWRGDMAYMVRYRPEIRPDEVPACASIIHPVKEFDDPVRCHYREVRSSYLYFSSPPGANPYN